MLHHFAEFEFSEAAPGRAVEQFLGGDLGHHAFNLAANWPPQQAQNP
jgi:hypothetical protein